MGEVIDFGAMEDIIVKVEAVFEANDLNIEEQSLVLKNLGVRINKKIQKNQTQDLMRDMPLGGLLKKLQKGGEDE